MVFVWYSFYFGSGVNKSVGARRLGRVNALKALYLIDIKTSLNQEEIFELINSGTVDSSVKEFTGSLVKGSIENLDIIDKYISKHAINWELERMAVIDRNIMRIATFEMLKLVETPINVIIDEAVEIAKEYSTAESGKFVNGVLDKVKEVRTIQNEPVKTN